MKCVLLFDFTMFVIANRVVEDKDLKEMIEIGVIGILFNEMEQLMKMFVSKKLVSIASCNALTVLRHLKSEEKKHFKKLWKINSFIKGLTTPSHPSKSWRMDIYNKLSTVQDDLDLESVKAAVEQISSFWNKIVFPNLTQFISLGEELGAQSQELTNALKQFESESTFRLLTKKLFPKLTDLITSTTEFKNQVKEENFFTQLQTVQIDLAPLISVGEQAFMEHSFSPILKKLNSFSEESSVQEQLSSNVANLNQ